MTVGTKSYGELLFTLDPCMKAFKCLLFFPEIVQFVEYSDDEEERKAKSKNRKSRHGQVGRVEESGTEERPTQGGPPQRGPRNKRHNQHR